MHENLRRIIQQHESAMRIAETYSDLHRRIEPILSAHTRLGPASERARLLEELEERRRVLASAIVAKSAWVHENDAITQLRSDVERRQALLKGPIDDARRLGLLDSTVDIRQSIASAIERQAQFGKLFRLPAAGEVERLMKDSQANLPLVRLAYGSDGARRRLQEAMESMQNPWLLLENTAVSARAFATIQAIGRALDARGPFEDVLGTALRGSLGDWREVTLPVPDGLVNPVARTEFYWDQGFDPALTNFTASAFEESVQSARLTPSPSGYEDERFVLAQEAFRELQRFEVAMRRFIDHVMTAAFGSTWMRQRLAGPMYEVWKGKRDTAVKAGAAEVALIDYADFSDYQQIIERKDNWRDVFKPIFGRVEDVRESLQRLQPVRIATMHARIITQDDWLLLLVETKRILKAIHNHG